MGACGLNGVSGPLGACTTSGMDSLPVFQVQYFCGPVTMCVWLAPNVSGTAAAYTVDTRYNDVVNTITSTANGFLHNKPRSKCNGLGHGPREYE